MVVGEMAGEARTPDARQKEDPWHRGECDAREGETDAGDSPSQDR